MGMPDSLLFLPYPPNPSPSGRQEKRAARSCFRLQFPQRDIRGSNGGRGLCIVFGVCFCRFFMGLGYPILRFQKFFRKVRGNNDARVFQHHTEFLWRVAFLEGFAKILLQYSGSLFPCFSVVFGR